MLRTLLAFLAQRVFSRSWKALEGSLRDPKSAQDRVLRALLQRHGTSRFGRDHHLDRISSYTAFSETVPLGTYEDHWPYLERMLKGTPHMLVRGKVAWFARSSGTTGATPKLIPVPRTFLRDNHHKAASQCIAAFLEQFPDSRLLAGKALTITGGLLPPEPPGTAVIGSISALLAHGRPWAARWFTAPGRDLATRADWKEKLRLLPGALAKESITAVCGIPAFLLQALERVRDARGAPTLREVWPGLELVLHGGTFLSYYQTELEQLIGGADVKFCEVYNASEGFFAFEFPIGSKDLLLLVDHGIFYEFREVRSAWEPPGPCLPLADTRLATTYEMVISTEGGLWRYPMGDLVQFTCLAPYKIRFVERTAYCLNLCCEKLTVPHADLAVAHACARTASEVGAYTVGPALPFVPTRPGHHWVFEFVREPRDLKIFMEDLDQALQRINSEYGSVRTYRNILQEPALSVVPPGRFRQAEKGLDLNKSMGRIPRVFRSRHYLEQLLMSLTERGQQ